MSKSLTIHHIETIGARTDLGFPDFHQDIYSKTTLGFWMYLMTDCLLFATLFTTYAVLHNETFGGPSSKDIFNLSTSFRETLILLISSVTCGFAMLSAVHNNKNWAIAWLIMTFGLGASFVGIEINEFQDLVREGNSWTRSAFLSSFFTLVGTHGLHVSIGLLWILVMIGQLIFTGLKAISFRRLVVFSMFWHFLDLIWIFIFTFVYLLGAL